MKALLILSSFLLVMLTDVVVTAQELLPRNQPPILQGTPAPISPDIGYSRIEIPLKYSLGGTFREIEQSIPLLDFNQKWMIRGSTGLKYRTWREPLIFSFTGNVLTMRADFGYHVKTEYGFNLPAPLSYLTRFLTTDQCGSAHQQFYSSTYIKTEFSRADNWRLVSTPPAVKTFYRINACPLKLGNEMAADIAMKPRQQELNAAADILNKTINAVDLHVGAEKSWQALSQPIAIGGSAWLAFNPTDITLDGPEANETSIVSRGTIILKPRIEMSKPFPTQSVLPRPHDNQTPKGFRLLIERQISFDEVSDFLENRLVGRQYKSADKAIQITAVGFTGTGEDVVLKVRFAGDVMGTVHFVGKLRFERPTTIAVTNLQLSELSDNYLTKASSDWVKNLSLVSDFESLSQRDLIMQLSQSTKEVRAALSESLSHLMQVSGALSPREILQTFAGNDEITVRFVSEGSLVLELKDQNVKFSERVNN